MKKTKLMLFFMLLGIGICFLLPIKVFAQITPDGNAEDWYNYITQFEDGFATATIDTYIYDDSYSPPYRAFTINIKQSPNNEFNDYYILYSKTDNEVPQYFKEDLGWAIHYWELSAGEKPFDVAFRELYEDVEFDGMIYWNFEEKYWQIDYYNKSEFNNKEVDMVTDLLDTLAEIGAGIGDLFGKIVESVGQFFYTPGTGDNPGGFTIIGILTIAAVVISLSMWVLRLILRLFKLRG